MNARGFTIIEVTLFLAITGLMMLGVLVGVSGAISRQIYENEVASLIDFVQGQYNLVDNVRNNRSSTVECGSGAITTGTGERLGTSSCSVVGRLITSSTDGSEFTSSPVYATGSISAPSTMTEMAYLQAMQLRVPDATLVPDDISIHRVTAGDVYVNGTTSSSAFSILIIKLPSSGITRTHVLSKFASSIDTMVGDSEFNAVPLRLCINAGRFGTPQSVGVRITPLAGTVAGVQRVAASDTGDQGC